MTASAAERPVRIARRKLEEEAGVQGLDEEVLRRVVALGGLGEMIRKLESQHPARP